MTASGFGADQSVSPALATGHYEGMNFNGSGSALSRVLGRLGLVSSDLRETLRQWLLLLWDHVADRFDRLSNQVSDRFDRVSGQLANAFEKLSDRVYDGADFDIDNLGDRAKRWNGPRQPYQSVMVMSSAAPSANIGSM
jgi:hypothetical protein